MIALIMAGGSGTRFWPLSTEEYPKQFLKLFDDKSMLRLTYERIASFIQDKDIYVVTTQNQSQLVLEHIPELKPSQIIIEPFGRNTAPCIGLAVAHLSQNYSPNEAILVLPADHYIPDKDLFTIAIKEAEQIAQDSKLITFGIVPTYPAVGYGYIEAGEAYITPTQINTIGTQGGAYSVRMFKEKPDLDTAKQMLAQGNFYWNSGMFCWTIQTIASSFEKYCPEILSLAHQMVTCSDPEEQKTIYQYMPRLPIDIAIMEKSEDVIVKPAAFFWSDVGNWHSLSDLMPKDDKENYSAGSLYADMAQNNAIFTKKKTAIIGASDLVIVETDEAILIVKKEFAERVKLVVGV